MDYSVGVIGCGFVGMAVARGFNLSADIRVYDIVPEKCSHSFEETALSDFVFICVPTPMESAEGGKADLSLIENVLDRVADMPDHPGPVYVIKSTVPVGTTERLREKYRLPILHNPEFLTARAALIDFITPSRTIVGGRPDAHRQRLAELFEKRFPGTPCYQMSSDDAEMVKYMANCFFATKVMFFNEMRLLSDELGLEWDDVMKGVMADGRIGVSHYQVPGHDGQRGYGGSCFPKDINAMISTFEKHGLDPLVLKAVWEQNKNVRETWDWASNPSAVSSDK